MSVRNAQKLLIYGYVRQIHELLGESTLIPLEIVEICFVFYQLQVRLFYTAKKSSTIYMCYGESILNLVLNPNNTDEPQMIKSGCYIPNISSFINIKNVSPLNPNKTYDGIIAFTTAIPEQNHHVGALSVNKTVILFDTCSKFNENIEYHSFICDNITPSLSQKHLSLMYCDDINAVLCCDDYGYVSMMNLQDINLSKQEFDFTQLSTKQLFTQSVSSFATVGYIHGSNKLFVIQNHFNVHKFLSFYKRHDKTQDKRKWDIMKDTSKCSFFDLNENKWIKTNAFGYQVYNKHYRWSAGICRNNKYDSSKVYVGSNIGHLGQFDTVKETWMMIYVHLKKRSAGIKPFLWMDSNPFVIHRTDYRHYKYFDVRDNSKKWKENYSMDIIAKNMSLSKHCNSKTFFM
eukprot:194550_1